MNGTSAATPQVTGLIALLFQRAAAMGHPLTAHQVQEIVSRGAKEARPHRHRLLPNAHVAADDQRREKQGDLGIWDNLIGDGKLDWPHSIAQL
jgi:hypothetical protein